MRKTPHSTVHMLKSPLPQPKLATQTETFPCHHQVTEAMRPGKRTAAAEPQRMQPTPGTASQEPRVAALEQIHQFSA